MATSFEPTVLLPVIDEPSCAARPLSPLRGLKRAVRGRSCFFTHFFTAAAVAMAALILSVDLARWCLLAGGLTVVFTAEMLAAAIESLASDHEGSGRRAAEAVELARGGVLVARIGWGVIAAAVMTSALFRLLGT